MTEDARFADGDPRPLALIAADESDLNVISALAQDAILPATEISYDARARQLALLINRFRWEDADQASRERRPFERVQALLLVRDVLRLQSDGIDRNADTVLELLAIRWQPGPDGTGKVTLEFAGDGTLAADVECINLELRDVTQPYLAPSGKMPRHPD